MLRVRVSAAERETLQDLADADGLTVSDVVRMLARREHKARFGEPKKKRKR